METLKLTENVRSLLASFGYVIKGRRGSDYSFNMFELILFWAFILYFNGYTLSLGSISVYAIVFAFCFMCLFYNIKLYLLSVKSNTGNKKLAGQAYVFWHLQYLKQFNTQYAFLPPAITIFLLSINGYAIAGILMACSIGLLWSLQRLCYEPAVQFHKLANKLKVEPTSL